MKAKLLLEANGQRTFAVIFETGDEAASALLEFAKVQKLGASHFTAIGAYAVSLLARGIEGLEGARREVEALGGRAIVVPTDVACAADVERAADTTEDQLGPIDIWINNAMVSVFSPIAEMTAAEFHRVTD